MHRTVLIHRGEHGTEEVRVEQNGDSWIFEGEGRRLWAEVLPLPDGRILLRFEDGRQLCGRVTAGRPGVLRVQRGAVSSEVALAEPLRDRIAHATEAETGEASEQEIRTQMPGRVVAVEVAAGDRVAAGDLLLVLEAMKMQNEIRSPGGGTVLSVDAEAGRSVEAGARLAVVRTD